MDGHVSVQDVPQGVLVRPLINGCVIRNIVPGCYFHPQRLQELQAQVILGKETHLELLLVEIFPEVHEEPKDLFAMEDLPTDQNQKLISKPQIHTCSLIDLPIFGTIKDIKALPQTYSNSNNLSQSKLDLLLIVSDSGMLSMVAVDNPQGSNLVESSYPRFQLVHQILLDHPGQHYQYLGRSIAVDPQSRSFAVAAWLSKFRVFFLPEIPPGSDIASADQTFPLPGIIWGMTYLYPIPSLPGVMRPVLVLIVFDDMDKSANLVMYEFFFPNGDMSKVASQVSRLPLGNMTVAGDGLPLHLIPLPFLPEALLVVTETQLLLVTSDQISSGEIAFPRLNLPPTPKDSQVPLITSWACPEGGDMVYLGSEKGYLYRVRVTRRDARRPGLKSPIELTQLGKVSDVALGSSMAVLASLGNWDLLAYSGDFSDGGLLWVSRDADNVALVADAKLSNWAPMLDFGYGPAADIQPKQSAYSNFPSSLFIEKGKQLPVTSKSQSILYSCSGVHPHGSVHCLRFGHLTSETKLITSLPAPICQLSSFHHQGLHAICLSLANTTRVLVYSNGLEDYTTLWNLHSDLESILISPATLGTESALVQVTTGFIHLVRAGARVSWSPEDNIIHAAIQGPYIAISTASSLILQQATLIPDGPSLSTVFQLNICLELSCLALLAERRLIIAGTHLPSIRIIGLDGVVHYELDLRQYQTPELSAPHSILFHPESNTLLVGLVDGTVLCFLWDATLAIKERYKVGYLPVTLSFLSPSRVLVVSDKMCIISFGPQGASVDPLLFPRHASLLNAVAFPPAACRPGTLGIVHVNQESVRESSLVATSVDPCPAPHALKLNVQGTPKRLHQNSSLDCLVVLVSEPVRGTTAIQGLDASTGAVRCMFRFAPGEIAHCFLLWDTDSACRQNPLRPRPVSRHSLYFVGIKAPDGGAILSLLLNENGSGDLDFTQVGYYPTDKMVYCLEQFSGEFLAAGSGVHLSAFYPMYDNGLQLVTLENVETRSVGAEILALSASQQTLAVATQPFSLFFFRLDETRSLNFANSGRYSRRVVSCIQLDDTLCLGCDRVGGSLFGLRLDAPAAKAPEGDAHWKVQPGAAEFFSFYLGEGATRLRKVDSPSWAAIGCTMLGTVFIVSPLPLDSVEPLLKLQKVLARFPLTRPLLGNDYHMHRQQSSMSPSAQVIDGWMLSQFLKLSLDQQRQLVASSTPLSRLIPRDQTDDMETPSLDSLVYFLRGLIHSHNIWPL